MKGMDDLTDSRIAELNRMYSELAGRVRGLENRVGVDSPEGNVEDTMILRDVAVDDRLVKFYLDRGSPEDTLVFSKPIGLRDQHPEEDVRPYPATNSPTCKYPTEQVCNEAGGCEPDIDEMKSVPTRRADPLGLQKRIDEVTEWQATEGEHDRMVKAWRAGHAAALDAAEQRVRAYMGRAFAPGTVEGVVQAVRGKSEFVDPTPTGFHQATDIDETDVIPQFGAPWTDDEPKDVDGNPDVRQPWTDNRAQRTDQTSILATDMGPHWQANR